LVKFDSNLKSFRKSERVKRMAANRMYSAIWLAALTAASMADEAARAEGPQRNDDSVHVAFCAECTSDMDWKSAALFASFASSGAAHCAPLIPRGAASRSHAAARARTATAGMRGQITRLLACSDLQLASYPPEALRMGPTYVHRNYRTHPRVPGDNSGSYNKVRQAMGEGRADVPADVRAYVRACAVLVSRFDQAG
jgi:hypothetical protein